METNGRVVIDIDTRVSCKCASNTVEINIKREKENILLKENGKDVSIGSSIAPPYPIPHLLFTNIDPRNMYHLLDSWFLDPILSERISVKVASEAERLPWPLYISLHVTLTPQRFIDTSLLLKDETEPDTCPETCAICLEEVREDLFQIPDCRHGFHTECIMTWLCDNNTCPLCRVVYVDDDDHPYDDSSAQWFL